METIDSFTQAHGGQVKLLPLKQRWNFMLISVICTVVFAAMFFIAYAKIFELAFIEETFRNAGRNPFSRYEIAREAQGYIMWLGLSGFLYFIAGVCGVVSFCLWINRATQNLFVYGVPRLSYTPGWAVGWFFIPLAQIVMGFLVVIQLWKGTTSIQNRDTETDWRKNPLGLAVIGWYVAFVGFIIYWVVVYMNLISKMMVLPLEHHPGSAVLPLEAFEAFRTTVKLLFYGMIASVALQGIFLIFFSKRITQVQENASN